MKLFIDTDVLLDVLLERTGFASSQQLLVSIERKEIKAWTSPLIFTNSFYIVSRLKDKGQAWRALQKTRLLLSVAPVTEQIIDQALASDFSDFEDAVQYYTAIQQNVDFLITRNKKDYPQKAQIPVLTPHEYLATRTNK
jgi:predicted nucleic acid-binding protein